jgi:hypothetical protein
MIRGLVLALGEEMAELHDRLGGFRDQRLALLRVGDLDGVVVIRQRDRDGGAVSRKRAS